MLAGHWQCIKSSWFPLFQNHRSKFLCPIWSRCSPIYHAWLLILVSIERECSPAAAQQDYHGIGHIVHLQARGRRSSSVEEQEVVSIAAEVECSVARSLFN
jgi:hypothetical protein